MICMQPDMIDDRMGRVIEFQEIRYWHLVSQLGAKRLLDLPLPSRIARHVERLVVAHMLDCGACALGGCHQYPAHSRNSRKLRSHGMTISVPSL